MNKELPEEEINKLTLEVINALSSNNITPEIREKFDTIYYSTKEKAVISTPSVDESKLEETIPTVLPPKETELKPEVYDKTDIDIEPAYEEPHLESTTATLTDPNEASIYDEKYRQLASSERRPLTEINNFKEEVIDADTQSEETQMPQEVRDNVTSTNITDNYSYADIALPEEQTAFTESMAKEDIYEEKVEEQTPVRVLAPNPYSASRRVTPGQK